MAVEAKTPDEKPVLDKESNGPKAKQVPADHIHKKIIWMFGFLALVFLTLLLAGGMAFKHSFAGYRGRGFNKNIYQNRGITMDRMYGFENNGFIGSNIVSGKVTAVSGKKFTVDDSGTKIDVKISDSTRFPISSATSVKTGDQVIVWGEKDSSGTVQAVRIVVNPNT